MKQRILSIIILTGIIILSVNAGFCTEQIAQHVPSEQAIPVKETAVSLTVTKFIITMAGVLLSSIVIWAGLTIYNKFFVKNNGHRSSLNDDILNTPKTIVEAVTFFIKKNKLN